MAHQTTPHPQTQADVDSAQSDLEPNQLAQDTGSDAALYENADGAQTADSRSFHITDNEGTNPRVVQELAPDPLPRTPHPEAQGITSRSVHEESEGQEKVQQDR